MLRRRLGLRTLLRRGTRAILASIWCRETHMARIKERLNLSNAKLTTTFEKKKNKAELSFFTCGKLGHFSNECPDRVDLKGKKKNVNLVTISNADEEYGNDPTILSVFQSPSWWVDTGLNIQVCADISMFSSYHGLQGSFVLMGNGSHASVRGISTIDLKFTSRKIMQLKNMQHVPTIHNNLVSTFLFLKDGSKVVLV
jgi:hypothetical protein